MGSNYISRPTPGIDSDFDPTGSTLTSLNVEDAIKELANTVGVSASPGFNFGRSGNLPANTWLNVTGSVPSNRAGITVALNSPEITQVFVANEDVGTFDVEIYEHEGNEVNLTLLGTVNIVSARSASFSTSIVVTSGRQLAIKISSGAAKNCNVGLQLKGNV
jgi:hypothetical protein